MSRLLLILILSQILTSCGGGTPIFTKRFTNASRGSVNSYVAKPVYEGENTSAVYASGNIDFAKHEQFRQAESDKKTIVSLDIYKSFTKKRWNFFYGASSAYGVFTFKGEELDINRNPSIIEANEKHDFYNIGLKGGFNYKISTSKFEFRFIGLKMLFNHEFGSYQDKLSAIEDVDESDRLENYKVFNKNPFFTVLIEKEIEYKINKNNSVSIGCFSGVNSIDFENSEMYGFMGSYKFKRFVLSYQYEASLIDEQYPETKKSGSHKVGAAYRLFK
ncbi:hypothetical protein [Aquimarina sp. RZ0]|uniref:hypothetical protein n=1 Tax=Aquimarina sp. RZ0 TaxID=2607730 RepID=UPI0011F1B7DA|nr:hypothetical protein [Aquimarina sp. RZ0]KAA1243116.1 hypothetical protein F0000_22410 [Aquimarina sp. RZ0]